MIKNNIYWKILRTNFWIRYHSVKLLNNKFVLFKTITEKMESIVRENIDLELCIIPTL